MKPVFLIYTHVQPRLFGRVVRRLAPYPVVVHVDAKIDVNPFVASLDQEALLRCHFLQERIHVNWAGYSQVQAIRSLCRFAVDRIADEDDYLVLLSGQDYPIRPIHELVRLLEAHPGRQYIRYFRVDDGDSKYANQVDRLHYRDLRLLQDMTLNSGLRRFRNVAIRLCDRFANSFYEAPQRPNRFEIAHGPTLFALTSQCVVDLEAAVTEEISSFFATTFCPEEKFYHTLVANSEYHKSTPAGGFEVYAGPGNYRYANLHLIDPTLVRVFVERDYDEVTASDKYFLRKVALPESTGLLDLIDQEQLGVTPH